MSVASAKPMDLEVELGPALAEPCHGIVLQGLRGLFARGELCDVRLVAGGESFPAHAAVLAAASGAFRELLLRKSSEQAAPFIVELAGVSHAESVRSMLSCMYGSEDGSAAGYNPSSNGVNRDILQLAQRFQIPQLEAEAAQWLAKGLNTSNVLERLIVCEEFGLTPVRDKILEQLTANPGALFVLAADPGMRKVPMVLQDLLVRVLQLLGCGNEGQGNPQKELGAAMKESNGKRAKKAGA